MNSTPNSNRKQIVFYGKTNAGKSTLLNKIIGQEFALVSAKEGTTTDPIQKAMELIPFGPVLFIDTAGLFDTSELGELRVKKTMETLKRTDLGIYVSDGSMEELEAYNSWKVNFEKYEIPYILVINKIDLMDEIKMYTLKNQFKDAYFVSSATGQGIEELKSAMIEKFSVEEERSIFKDIVPYDGKVVMVVPVDSEAPKGRLILPQVQCIRDCLDNGIKSYVLRDTELASGLNDLKSIDLVVTDSQAFKKVAGIVPKEIRLTSFSMLFAKNKGNLPLFVEGAKAIERLKPGDKVLMAESCTHNVSHEDIGRVKIPKMLNKHIGGELIYDYKLAYDFPEDLSEYKMVIHCGGCMINRKTIINRANHCEESSVPITNYGVAIAYLTGILDRVNCI